MLTSMGSFLVTSMPFVPAIQPVDESLDVKCKERQLLHLRLQRFSGNMRYDLHYNCGRLQQTHTPTTLDDNYNLYQ